MKITQTKPLFAWDCLDDSPSLKTIRELLAAVPAGKLLDSLRCSRGRGRDDYPVHVLWGVVVLTIVLRHPTTEAGLAELRRNADLRRLIGIDSETAVPSKWTLSRFEETLGSEPHRRLPGHDGTSNIVYDEAGTLHCYDQVSRPIVRHKMADIGHEPAGQTLKYRCPARHEGWACPMSKHCNAGKSYGLTVRVKREIDLRRFPPLPRATKKFERLYKTRTAVERINGRLKVFWGADDGNITGSRRFHAKVGVVLIVHAAFATLLAPAPRKGTLGKMNLSPIAQALQQKLNAA